MRFSVTVIKHLSGAALLGLALHAQAAPAAEPVKVNLQVFKVTLSNGKETLIESKTVKPGETLEYRATYSNVSKKNISNLAATLPVPKGMEFVAQSAKPVSVDATVDGREFAPVPLMRKKAAGGEEPVPVAEYRALRWKAVELQSGKSYEVSARMRVSAAK
ncbi:MAG TPA: hypothetical protein VFW49_15385 [Fluviicoccus sp.]|nr:hypothetical protein [Fluviicoccus sp.]